VLVLAYKEVPLPRNYQASPIDTTALLHSVEHDLVLLGLVGLQDPLRPEATGAVNACHRAGVRVVMLTGDNATTATAIAQQCHILPSLHHAQDHDSFAVMEGKEFRSRVLREDGSIDDHQFLKIWPRLRVVARCSPEDKYVLVNAARRCAGEVVAVTGDGTNDAPALRAAAVGFAMNNGTAVAKEAADIVLLDDNFASITSALLWGRGTYANVARFLQFQLTINVVAVATAVGGALTTAQSPLTAVQMLWVNLIMDSLASLALATEPPELALLDAPPYAPDHDFLSLKSPLAKHVVGQATYQLVVMAWLLGFAPEVLHFPAHSPGQEASLHHTLVFNAFVMMQLFNQVNARKVADVENIAEGLLQASMFAAILCGEAVLQAVLVEKGGPAFGTVPLPFEMWALCLGFGAGSLLVRELLRRLPNFMGGRNGT
jgi:P-type Ca2+ transporter type 2B